MIQSDDEKYESRLDNVIFAGLIGLVVILIEATRNQFIPYGSPIYDLIVLYIVSFTAVVLARIYSIILKANSCIILTTRILRIFLIPMSLFLIPNFFYIQYFSSTTITGFLIFGFFGTILMMLAINQAFIVEEIKKRQKTKRSHSS